MHSHDLALLLLEWPNAPTMVEHEEKYFPEFDVEVDLDGHIHFVARA